MRRPVFVVALAAAALQSGCCPTNGFQIANLTPFAVHVIGPSGETLLADLPPGAAAFVSTGSSTAGDVIVVIAPGQGRSGRALLPPMKSCANDFTVRPSDFP
jgi:hypothetical protein